MSTLSTSEKTFVGYFESWSAPWSDDPQCLQLANIAPYVNMVIVSFMQPDATYPGGDTMLGTGLEFSSDPSVVKKAIAVLKQRNPQTRVLIGVGGAAYSKFGDLNPGAVAGIVKNFGFDGVDINYDPHGRWSDDEYRHIVRAIRQALPRPYLVTVAAKSVGAYGEGEWANAQPSTPWTGMLLGLLRSPEAEMIDQLNVMSYDAGTSYNPVEAMTAYQHIFKGNIVMGVSVAPEIWGGHVCTLAEVERLAQAVIDQNAAGMMLWSLQKRELPGTPTAQQIAQKICEKLSLGDCSRPLFG